MSEARLVLSGVSKTYKLFCGELDAVRNVTFGVKSREVVSVIGPSGCGKTTLLKMAAGLLRPTSGDIQVSPRTSHPLMIFQQYERCLLPYMNVEENIRIALVNLSLDANDQTKRVEDSLRTTGLLESRSLYTNELSGGMKQRVLLARCLAAQPPCLLLDEPFASVDAQARYELEDQVRLLAETADIAAVYVTHDIDSAIYCGDRLIVLSARPARVLEDLTVPLESQRDQVATRSGRRFTQLRADVYGMLKEARA